MRECLIWEIRMAAELSQIDTDKAVEILSNILELELAGVVRYMHYSFMIFGHNRIPIVAWVRSQGDVSQGHAVMREALVHEQEGLAEYHKLLILVAGRNIMLEEYARAQIAAEEAHAADIGKMLRKPGSIA
jgi:bacterioferritin